MQINILPATEHDHAAAIGVSEDLINTLELSEEGPTDGLASPEDAVAFLAERGLAHRSDLEAQAARGGDRWLARVVEVRAALREVWDAVVGHRPPAADALATLNRLLDRAPRIELVATASGVEVSHRHADDDPTARPWRGSRRRWWRRSRRIRRRAS